MNKAIGITLTAGLCGLCIGAGTAHFVHVSTRSQNAPPPAVPRATVVRPTHKAPDLTPVYQQSAAVITNTVVVTNGVALERMEAEIASLNRQLEQRTFELTSLQGKLEQPAEPPSPPRESYREREARMQEEEPERYAEIQKQREAFRTRTANVVADRAQFLEELDTASMSEDEKLAHDELLQRIAGTWTTIEQLQSGEATADHDTRHQLHEQFSRIRELYELERNYVLRQVGEGLGFDENQAADFSSFMTEVYEMTSPQLPRDMFRRGGPGPGSRPTTPAPSAQ